MKIKKIKSQGEYCYPATIAAAVKDANFLKEDNSPMTLGEINLYLNESIPSIEGLAAEEYVDNQFYTEHPSGIFINGYEAIDLGLTSNGKHLLWAKCNIGANTETDYGLYFQWGDTQGYVNASSKTFNWANYKWNPSGDGSTFTKYNDTDGKTVLDLEDDAAHVNMGDNWKMPTTEQQKELYDNTTWTLTTIDGVKGYKVESKTNDNYIFLPAAGYCSNSSVYYVGSSGYYWSSSRSSDPVGAYGIGFDSSNIDPQYDDDRYSGFSVRAVVELTDDELEAAKKTSKYYTKSEVDNVINNLATVATSGSYSDLSNKPTIPDTYSKSEIDAKLANIGGGSPVVVAVDLGLPSGLRWASCNVGATKPEEYGEYFAWGEIEGYGSDTGDGRLFDWDSYKFGNPDAGTLSKYNNDSEYGTVDNKTTLETEDNAASQNLGLTWRMPTTSEWEELTNNTTVVWTTFNGINGGKFTGTNGNWIFIPAAGYRYGSDLYDVGSYGFYWSSSLCEDYPSRSWYFYFYSGCQGMSIDDRCCGFSVRPVLEIS